MLSLFYTSSPRGRVLTLVWDPAPRGLPAGLQARPLGPRLASAGGGHPRRRAEGEPRTNPGSAQPVAPGCPASGAPAPAPFPPRRPGRTAPGYLRAAGGGWRLRSLCARGWLRRSDHGPSTGSHLRGPGSGGSTRARKRVNRPAFSSSDATTEARARNRARAAAQVPRRRVPGLGVGAREARSSRLLPEAGSGCRETSRCVFSSTAGASQF